MGLVEDYCTKPVITAQRGESLRWVAERMREHHVGCVVVVEGLDGHAKPIGILTDRDIVVRLLAQTTDYLEQVRADDIMAQPLVTVGLRNDVAEALRIMRSAGVRRAPVVGSGGELVGLLSFDDLLDYLQDTVDDLSTLLGRERRYESVELPTAAPSAEARLETARR